MKSFGTTILRLGMAAVIVWFGVQQIIDPKAWIGFLPDWITTNTIINSYVSSRGIVMLNGWFEIFFGALLFIGFLTRLSALLLGAHLFAIAYSIGYDSIGMRDVGLAVATISMMVSGGGKWAFDSLFESSGSASAVPPAPGLSSTMSPAMQGGGKAIGAMSYTSPAQASGSGKLAPLSGGSSAASSSGSGIMNMPNVAMPYSAPASAGNPMAAPTVSMATGTAANPNTQKAIPFVAPPIKDFIIGGNNSSIPPIPAPSMPSTAPAVVPSASSVSAAPSVPAATTAAPVSGMPTAPGTSAVPASAPAAMPAMPASMPSMSASAPTPVSTPASSIATASMSSIAPSNLPIQNMADILLDPKHMQPASGTSSQAAPSAISATSSVVSSASAPSTQPVPQVLSSDDLSTPVDLNAPASAPAPSTTPDAVISPTSTTTINNLGQLGPLG